MKKNYIKSALLIFVFALGCQFFKEKPSELPKDWEMIDMYEDQIDEINEGGYYALYYNEIRKNDPNDSIPPDEEINDNIVAIAIEDHYTKDKSRALIWAADSKQTLFLTKNEVVEKKSYHREYANEDFTVELDMKFSERIDGLDDLDMLIYKGKMKVRQNGTDVVKEFKVKGGN